MAKQRVVLQEAQAAGALVRDEEFTAAAPGGAPGATLAPAPAPAPARPKGAASAAAQAAADGATEMTEQQPAAKDDPPLPTPGHRQAPTPPPSPPGGAPAGASSHKPAQVVPVGNDAIAELVKNEQSRAAEEAMNAKEEKPRFLSCPDRKMLYAMFMALLPCLIFIVSCFVLAVIENFHYDCYDTSLFPDHAAIVASDRCWTLPVDAFYYSIITLSTIGYGDVTPHSTGGKVRRALPSAARVHPWGSAAPAGDLHPAVSSASPPPLVSARALTGAVRPRSCSPRFSSRLPSSR